MISLRPTVGQCEPTIWLALPPVPRHRLRSQRFGSKRAITSFAQADGFLRIDALADQMPAGTEAEVTLFTPHARVPDLVIVGSHYTGLDRVTARLAHAGLSVRSIAVGSLGGLAAAKRGECHLAPIHLFDDKTETYKAPIS